jgi:hypothetical protein
MSTGQISRTAARASGPPPAIRLVEAFVEAIDAAGAGRTLNDEAFFVEGLLIAAEASHDALVRFAGLWFEVSYGDEPSDEASDEEVVLGGYQSWLDAARNLRDRLASLKAKGYESHAADRLDTSIRGAEGVLDDARSRRQLERDALTNEQLADLAAKIEARRLDVGRAEGTP